MNPLTTQRLNPCTKQEKQVESRLKVKVSIIFRVKFLFRKHISFTFPQGSYIPYCILWIMISTYKNTKVFLYKMFTNNKLGSVRPLISFILGSNQLDGISNPLNCILQKWISLVSSWKFPLRNILEIYVNKVGFNS